MIKMKAFAKDEIREKLAKLDAAEEAVRETQEDWELFPENKVLEEYADKAYIKACDIRKELRDDIVMFTKGKVDALTAMKMLTERREDLETILKQ